MMEKDAKIYVAGHRGMVGSAIIRRLEEDGWRNIITRTHAELNLCRQDEVERFLRMRNRIMYFWQPRRLAALWPTAALWRILCMKI